jgi:thioredoxin-like negative regulator of GroEL
MSGDKMKKKIMIFLGVAIAIGAIAAIVYASLTLNKQKEIEDTYLIELSYNELEEKINNKESFVVVFTQSQCAHCHEYKPILKRTLAKVELYAYEIVLDKLSKEEGSKLNDIANVSQTPTTVFIKNGQEINSTSRLLGVQNEDKLIKRFKTFGYIE